MKTGKIEFNLPTHFGSGRNIKSRKSAKIACPEQRDNERKMDMKEKLRKAHQQTMTNVELDQVSGGDARQCMEMLALIDKYVGIPIKAKFKDQYGNIYIRDDAQVKAAAVELKAILNQHNVGSVLDYNVFNGKGNKYYLKDASGKSHEVDAMSVIPYMRSIYTV